MAPTVIVLDILLFRKFPQPKIIASVFIVCLGIAVGQNPVQCELPGERPVEISRSAYSIDRSHAFSCCPYIPYPCPYIPCQVATVTDSQMLSNVGGMAIGAAATIVTALYQVGSELHLEDHMTRPLAWAGSKTWRPNR